MTIFKILYFPFLAPTKMSLTFSLAEKEKIKVSKLTHSSFQQQRVLRKVKTTLEKHTPGPPLWCWTEKGTQEWSNAVPATGKPQKDHRQHYKHLQNSPAHLQYRIIFNIVKIQGDITSSLSGFPVHTVTQHKYNASQITGASWSLKVCSKPADTNLMPARKMLEPVCKNHLPFLRMPLWRVPRKANTLDSSSLSSHDLASILMTLSNPWPITIGQIKWIHKFL